MGSFTCWVRVDDAKYAEKYRGGNLTNPCSLCSNLTYPDYGGEVVLAGGTEDTVRQDVKLSGGADDGSGRGVRLRRRHVCALPRGPNPIARRRCLG